MTSETPWNRSIEIIPTPLQRRELKTFSTLQGSKWKGTNASWLNSLTGLPATTPIIKGRVQLSSPKVEQNYSMKSPQLRTKLLTLFDRAVH